MAANQLPAKKNNERIALNNQQLVFLIQANRWVRKAQINTVPINTGQQQNTAYIC